jgi:hypothetical protein
VGADVSLLEDVNGQALYEFGMALALTPGSATDIVVVSDGHDVWGIDIASRQQAWKVTQIGTGSRVQFVSTPNVTYIATNRKLTAISPKDGAILFTKDTLWGLPSDLAIGPNRTLYVSEQVLLYRAGPNVE